LKLYELDGLVCQVYEDQISFRNLKIVYQLSPSFSQLNQFWWIWLS